jgi:nitrate reductase NapAB chaperone NapD
VTITTAAQATPAERRLAIRVMHFLWEARFNGRAEMYTLQCTFNATPVREAIAVPISGLVLSLDRSHKDHDETIRRLNAEPAIEIGERSSYKCAIVVDAASKADDQKLFTWVCNLPAVVDVQVAFVGFDDAPSDQHTLPPDSSD